VQQTRVNSSSILRNDSKFRSEYRVLIYAQCILLPRYGRPKICDVNSGRQLPLRTQHFLSRTCSTSKTDVNLYICKCLLFGEAFFMRIFRSVVEVGTLDSGLS
jgi:hypothetical protein